MIKLKKDFVEQDFVQEFMKINLPSIDTIEEIDENFRQHLFAQWITNDRSPEFVKLKTKLRSFLNKTEILHKVYLNPANFEHVEREIGDLTTEMKFNDTSKVNFVLPYNLRFALFSGWEEQGFSFVRLLHYYGKTFEFLVSQ